VNLFLGHPVGMEEGFDEEKKKMYAKGGGKPQAGLTQGGGNAASSFQSFGSDSLHSIFISQQMMMSKFIEIETI
jgi:DnaJ-class molecular chaperone